MSTVVNKSKLKTNITNINSTLTSLASELQKLSKNLDTMMKGNSDGPYWNGQAASKFYKKAVTNVKNDIEDYKTAYTKISKIAVKYEKAVKEDK